MVENTECFNNNPEDRYDNPKDIGFRLVLWVKVSVHKEIK